MSVKTKYVCIQCGSLTGAVKMADLFQTTFMNCDEVKSHVESTGHLVVQCIYKEGA